MSKQDVYVAQLKLQLLELNERLEAIEARAGEVGEDLRARYAAELALVREHARVAGLKFHEVQAAAAGSWHGMVGEMEKLRHAWTDSLQRLRSMR